MTTKSSSTDSAPRIATVVGVKESLVTIDISQGSVMKNEVGFILVGEERLKSEVLMLPISTPQ